MSIASKPTFGLSFESRRSDVAAIIPTRMIGVPPYSLVVDEAGRVVEVGPWLALTNLADPNAAPCVRLIDGQPRTVSPDKLVALVVPSTQDAVRALIDAGFEIQSMEVIDT